MVRINKNGRSYFPGKASGSDIRNAIIDQTYQGLNFSDISNNLGVDRRTASRVWNRFSATGSTEPAKKGRRKADTKITKVILN